MISNYLSAIEGVEIFPIISLILFFIVFAIASIWVIRLKKDYIQSMSELPLTDISEVDAKEKNNE
jgi:cytochrome c oxidase cbb3-type subunit IV